MKERKLTSLPTESKVGGRFLDRPDLASIPAGQGNLTVLSPSHLQPKVQGASHRCTPPEYREGAARFWITHCSFPLLNNKEKL